MRIGIIDDSLADNSEKIKFASVQVYEVSNGSIKENAVNRKSDGMTHGTVCYNILNEYTNYLEGHSLLYINIMNDRQLDIDDFILAMEFCLNSKIDILCLSIGTTMPSTAGKIYSVIKKLSEKGVFIIAASSNSNLVTYPAVFKEVLGVMALPHKFFSSRTMYCIPDNDLGINIGMVTEKVRSNSFSSPMILAKLLNKLQNEISSKEIIYNVINKETRFATQKQLWIIEQELLPKDNEPVPIVIVEKENTESYVFMEKIMQCLYETYNYESVSVIESDNISPSFRFIKFNATTFNTQLQNRFNTDIDILFITSTIRNNIVQNEIISEDLYIKLSNTTTMLSAGEHSIKYYSAVDEVVICRSIVLLLAGDIV